MADPTRKLPTFIVIGAQKCGTTSLWAYLRAHPRVFMPEMKETGFFAEDIRWNLGLDWYRSLFAPATDQIALGEASTFYSMFPFADGVPERMASICPDVKLIYMVRDPIARMRSAFVHALWDGTERRPISKALLWDPRYVTLSRYALQLDQYLGSFDRSQIMVVATEDLRDRRQETLDRIFRFIGVEQGLPIDASSEENTSEGKRALRVSGRLIKWVSRRKVLPDRVAWRLARLRSHPMASRVITPEETIIDNALRATLVELLRQDLERLRPWMGPTYDCWGLLKTELASRLRDASPSDQR